MDELIPIIGMVLVLGPAALWAASVTPIGRALTDRLRGRGAGDDRVLDLQDDVDRLHDHIAQQDQRIEELHERVDFTERLLAGPTSSDREDASTPV